MMMCLLMRYEKTTIKLAKPQGVKLVIKSIDDSIAALKSGVTDKYKLIHCSGINREDAYKLAEAYPEIKPINRRIKAKLVLAVLEKAVNILPEEEERLKRLIDKQMEVEIRQVPADKKVDVGEFCKKGRNSMIVQAVLLGIVAFIAQSEYALGTSLLSRPIVTGLFTGIVLGDVKTGIVMGATLELAFIGSFSVGASIPPDVVTGGILGTAFAIYSWSWYRKRHFT